MTENLSTGYADAEGTTIPGGSEDDDWRIVADETESGPVPRPASVVDEETAEYHWESWFSGTKWISHSVDASVGVSEPSVVYEYCFCLNEGATDPRLSLIAQADDEIGDVRINGTSVPYSGTGTYNDAPIEELYTDPSLFREGDNCLQIRVDDIGGYVSGLNVQAEFEAENADCACTDDSCPPVERRPATGYDQDTGTMIAGGSPDDDWTIVTDTTNSGAVPRAATVVYESDADYLWPDPESGTKWIAHTADGRVDSSGQTITYEYCFCLNEGFAEPELSLIARSDDKIADLRLNGTSLSYSARGGKNDPIQQTYTDRSVFQSGENCLQIEVRDTGGVASGLNADVELAAINADCGCITSDCPPAEFDLASGYDQATETLLGDGASDDDWTIVTDTTDSGSVPRPATVVDQDTADYYWPEPESGTRWIAHQADAGITSDGQTITYEYCFCLNDDFSEPSLSLVARADDKIPDVRLNGQSLSYSARGGKNDPIQQTYTDPTRFQSGENCLQIEVRDVGGIVSGLDVDGQVSALDADCDC